MRSLSNLIKSTQCDHATSLYIVTKEERAEAGDSINRSFGGDGVLYSAYDQARVIIEEANKSGEELIRQKAEKFKQECCGIKENARKEGFEKGFAEGVNEGRETGYRESYQQGILEAKENNEKFVEELAHIIEELKACKSQIIEKEHNNLTVLAVGIAEKILNQTLKDDETQMCAMIEQALEQYQHQEWLNCYFSCGFFDALKNNAPEFMEQFEENAKGIRFLPRKELEDTDCIIELSTEVIDFSVDTQLNKIKTLLQK